MKIKFKHCRRKRIRKFLSGFHGKERTDLYKIFTAIAYLVYTGCQWKMLPRYLMGRKLPSPRPLVGAFLHLFRSRWSPIAPSRAKENHSTIDRPAVNIYCRTGSNVAGYRVDASSGITVALAVGVRLEAIESSGSTHDGIPAA